MTEANLLKLDKKLKSLIKPESSAISKASQPFLKSKASSISKGTERSHTSHISGGVRSSSIKSGAIQKLDIEDDAWNKIVMFNKAQYDKEIQQAK